MNLKQGKLAAKSFSKQGVRKLAFRDGNELGGLGEGEPNYCRNAHIVNFGILVEADEGELLTSLRTGHDQILDAQFTTGLQNVVRRHGVDLELARACSLSWRWNGGKVHYCVDALERKKGVSSWVPPRLEC